MNGKRKAAQTRAVRRRPQTEYIFDQHSGERELTRLKRIEFACDAQSQKLLTRAGVRPGWHCLEIGAGAGSILQWLGERVGSSGQAIGLDKNISFLTRFASAPFKVMQGDLLKVEGVGPFNLIHGRYLLIHNPSSPRILEKLKSLLNPGDHLVLEEPDFEAAEWIDDPHRGPGQRVNEAIRAMFWRRSLDPGYGKRLPWMLSRMGFAVEQVEAISHLEKGGEPIALLMADSAEALRNSYVSTGKATSDDVDAYIAAARDGASWAQYYSTVGVIAVRK